jgi:hypothetical protein
VDRDGQAFGEGVLHACVFENAGDAVELVVEV